MLFAFQCFRVRETYFIQSSCNSRERISVLKNPFMLLTSLVLVCEYILPQPLEMG